MNKRSFAKKCVSLLLAIVLSAVYVLQAAAKDGKGPNNEAPGQIKKVVEIKPPVQSGTTGTHEPRPATDTGTHTGDHGRPVSPGNPNRPCINPAGKVIWDKGDPEGCRKPNTLPVPFVPPVVVPPFNPPAPENRPSQEDQTEPEICISGQYRTLVVRDETTGVKTGLVLVSGTFIIVPIHGSLNDMAWYDSCTVIASITLDSKTNADIYLVGLDGRIINNVTNTKYDNETNVTRPDGKKNIGVTVSNKNTVPVVEVRNVLTGAHQTIGNGHVGDINDTKVTWTDTNVNSVVSDHDGSNSQNLGFGKTPRFGPSGEVFFISEGGTIWVLKGERKVASVNNYIVASGNNGNVLVTDVAALYNAQFSKGIISNETKISLGIYDGDSLSEPEWFLPAE